MERRIRSGAKQKTIVEELRALFPGVRGISVRSIKRFCSNHGLHMTMRLNDRALDVVVAFGIVNCDHHHYHISSKNSALSFPVCGIKSIEIPYIF